MHISCRIAFPHIQSFSIACHSNNQPVNLDQNYQLFPRRLKISATVSVPLNQGKFTFAFWVFNIFLFFPPKHPTVSQLGFPLFYSQTIYFVISMTSTSHPVPLLLDRFLLKVPWPLCKMLSEVFLWRRQWSWPWIITPKWISYSPSQNTAGQRQRLSWMHSGNWVFTFWEKRENEQH